MEYRKCVNCGFNVTPKDERCANCGVLHPLESLTVKPDDYSFLITLTVLACLLIPALYFGSQAGIGGVICCALPVGLIFVFFFGGISGAISKALTDRSQKTGERHVESRKTPHPESLVHKENIIKRRISELSGREQKVKAVLDRAKQSSGEKWEQVRETLSASIQTLKRQHARYSAKSIEIETVRLQNKLAPFISNTDRFSYEQIDAHLKTIEEVQNNANGLTKKLDEQRRVLGSVPDIEELAQRLSEIQESMRKLRDALIGRQAVLALKGITPLDDALAPVSPPVAAIRESEVFNIQVAITDFSASFDELESEYVRVQSEEDVAQKVSEIINRAEGS
ncbi:MAG: hypothetical protein M3416_08005 [Acidobacteriota bacterium]|nr:hypothetical protein [Acidobacteriota bacterium]